MRPCNLLTISTTPSFFGVLKTFKKVQEEEAISNHSQGSISMIKSNDHHSAFFFTYKVKVNFSKKAKHLTCLLFFSIGIYDTFVIKQRFTNCKSLEGTSRCSFHSKSFFSIDLYDALLSLFLLF